MSYALPLVVLFSNGAVENMVQWYLGFSIILIGLYFILKDSNKDGAVKVVICRALRFDNRQESWSLMMLSFFLVFTITISHFKFLTMSFIAHGCTMLKIEEDVKEVLIHE